VCGADRDVPEGGYGTVAPRQAELVIGHEGLGEVLTGCFAAWRCWSPSTPGVARWCQAAKALTAVDLDWLREMIARRVPVTNFGDALVRKPGELKVAVDLTV